MILNTNESHLPANLSEQAQDVIYQMAQEMGILVTVEEAAAVERFMESADASGLTEAGSVVRLSRQAKMDSLVVRSALVIAQQKKDPLFAKYARAAAMKRQLRGMIVKKYGGQANVTARKLLANAGKRNMVDVPTKASTFSHPESR